MTGVCTLTDVYGRIVGDLCAYQSVLTPSSLSFLLNVGHDIDAVAAERLGHTIASND